MLLIFRPIPQPIAAMAARQVDRQSRTLLLL